MALLFASSDRKQLPARLRTMLILARPPRSFQRDGHQAILLGGYRPMAFRPVPCGAGCFPDALGCYRQLDMLDAKLRSASTIAFATAASPGVIPPSLPPRMPSGFVVDGTSLISVSKAGSRSARGIA